MRASAKSRRYIYRVLAAALLDDMRDREGWVLGGVVEEPERRRLLKESTKVIAELLRKGDAPETSAKTSEAEQSTSAQQGSGAAGSGPQATRAALAPAEAPKSRDCCPVCGGPFPYHYDVRMPNGSYAHCNWRPRASETKERP